MLIRDSVWEDIREQFTEAEKVILRKAVTGIAICPKGILIDPDSLDGALRAKITAATAAHPSSTDQPATGRTNI